MKKFTKTTFYHTFRTDYFKKLCLLKTDIDWFYQNDSTLINVEINQNNFDYIYRLKKFCKHYSKSPWNYFIVLQKSLRKS